MKRNTAWKILNPILLVLAINQVATAIIFDVQGSSKPIMSEEAFEFVHEGAGFVFAGLILLHVILNFAWVRANFLKSPSR